MGKSTTIFWIFDTGATIHATSTLGCLVDQFDDVACSLMLPDGSIMHSTRQGSDRSARAVIGAGERKGGLYYFCELLMTSAVSLLAIQIPELEL
ncbi:hypothetical protein LIER_19401 [Lithospermum erythrorhizon]|uniref:Uncharacterized protein n=1 Tax=Lithospermum erythrorhizon TaxID=34254 RepID=A0AAV3QK94_LITER